MVTSPFSIILRSDRSGGMVESPLTFKAGRYWNNCERMSQPFGVAFNGSVVTLKGLLRKMVLDVISELNDVWVIGLR